MAEIMWLAWLADIPPMSLAASFGGAAAAAALLLLLAFLSLLSPP